MDFNLTHTSHVISSEYLSVLPDLITKDLSLNLFNLLIYSAGLVLYAIVIWNFYRNLGKRILFEVDLKRPESVGFFGRIVGFIGYMFRSLLIFPIISFTWFIILSGFLLFLSKSHDVSQILLMSMTIITVSRITAYFNEDLAKDVAKLIPFGLLAVFIVDPTYFNLQATITKFFSIPTFLHLILQYLISIVILEFLLRTGYRLKTISSARIERKPS